MSPGLISRVVVADKIAAIRRMVDGIHSLPLESLATFTADPKEVTDVDDVVSAITGWLHAHPERVDAAE